MSLDSYAPSVQRTLNHYARGSVAERYRTRHVGTARHTREEAAIARALRDVPAGARVLDLPCGTGRMLPLLARLELRVTAADGSAEMAARAAALVREKGLESSVEAVVVANVFATGFPDGAFEAVVANRLFQHFPEPDARQQALKELARISRGPLVVSFFCTRAVDYWIRRIQQKLFGREVPHRVTIPYAAFARDVRAAGLRVERVEMARPYVSQQWYAILRPAR